MKNGLLLQNPKLKKLVREWDKGDVLFLEGDSANTVILILEGAVELSQKRPSGNLNLGVISEGDFIGEKALFKAEVFRRRATARAVKATTALELGSQEFSDLEREAPQLHTLLLKKAFQMVLERFENADRLCEVLKSYDLRKRFLNYVAFLSERKSECVPGGKTVELNHEVIATNLNCAPEDAKELIAELCKMGILSDLKNSKYSVLREEQLSELDLLKAA